MYSQNRYPSSLHILLEILCGENHILLGVSPNEYEKHKRKLERASEIQSLFKACCLFSNAVRGSLVENITWNELSRKQVNKDLMRERVIINNTPFDYNDDNHALKLFLLDKVTLPNLHQ